MAAAATRAPKQWYLGKNETVTTFNAWKDNLLYTLSLDSRFAPFLVADATWGKVSSLRIPTEVLPMTKVMTQLL